MLGKKCIQLVKGYQNHPHMTLHDLPFVKEWGSKNSLVQILGILRVEPEPYVMETRGHAYIMIEEVKSYHNICNKYGFTIFGCVSNFGPKFHMNFNCLIARQRYLRKIGINVLCRLYFESVFENTYN